MRANAIRNINRSVFCKLQHPSTAEIEVAIVRRDDRVALEYELQLLWIVHTARNNGIRVDRSRFFRWCIWVSTGRGGERQIAPDVCIIPLSSGVRRERRSQERSKIIGQKRRPDQSAQDECGCQQPTPNQAVAAMFASAPTHPYQTSIRVVHHYLPIRSRVGPGETLPPLQLAFHLHQPNRDDNEGLWLFSAEHVNTRVNAFAHSFGHHGFLFSLFESEC